MKILNTVPYINQMPKWPTGCESVSTVMLLDYCGISIGVDEFISYLPTSDLMIHDQKLIGQSPFEYFIGSPYDPDSYGCYADVIVNTVNKIASEKGLPVKAIDISELSTADIIERYVKCGIPVLYWATIDLKPSYPGTTWTLPNGTSFIWINNEHCMLLVGVSDTEYWFNDPWNNHGVIGYPKNIVEMRHLEMRSMAAAIIKI